MSRIGQIATKKVYENPKVVQGYVKRHAKDPEMIKVLKSFAASLPGKRVVDIGCGPGHDSYLFAELGFEVTGIDYSKAMIEVAKNFKKIDDQPYFKVMDMRKIGKRFKKDSFDGAWICASLYHLPKEEMFQFLQNLHQIIVTGGKVFIGIKKGSEGEILLRESKYGTPMVREVVFWEREELRKLFEKTGFNIIHFEKKSRGTTGNKKTRWLDFQLEVVK